MNTVPTFHSSSCLLMPKGPLHQKQTFDNGNFPKAETGNVEDKLKYKFFISLLQTFASIIPNKMVDFQQIRTEISMSCNV